MYVHGHAHRLVYSDYTYPESLCHTPPDMDSQSARRGHVFHTLPYLYRKYVVYFGCQAHAPRASALRERQCMRIHDNILRTRCMNVIVYGCARFYD